MKEKIYEFLMRLRAKGHRRLIDEMLWVYRYARLYRKQMFFYTALGLVGTAVSLLSSLVSRDMVDIITGHETGLFVRTFAIFIGLNVGNIFLNQTSTYFSNRISISVDNAIKADVFDQMLVTDLESLQKYHTGDLLTRWSNDASTISGGILNWIPNLIIYTVRLVSTFAMVFYHDPWFALIAMLGMPVSILTTRHMLNKMRQTNSSVAAMNAKMTGFNAHDVPAALADRLRDHVAGGACDLLQLLRVRHLPCLERRDLLRHDDDVFSTLRLPLHDLKPDDLAHPDRSRHLRGGGKAHRHYGHAKGELRGRKARRRILGEKPRRGHPHAPDGHYLPLPRRHVRLFARGI